MENRSGESARTSRILRTYHGGEYTSVDYGEYLKLQEVRHERVTIPKCPEQNGTAERFNRTLVQIVA